jgi:type I restriction enzyme, S subunit
MNPARLLQHFDRISEAPDAIPRLRRFLLDLAVRGKLVEQDHKDEPVAELLQLVQEGAATHTDPTDWISGAFGSLLEMQYGKGLPAKDRKEQGEVPVFGSNGIVGYTDAALTDKPAIIVGRKGSAGALNLCDGPSWTTDVAYFLVPPDYFDVRFLIFTLKTLDLGALGKGVKPGLSRSDAYQLRLPVPPLAEQHRIVAKVDELMALCDQLEAAKTKREQSRDRLVAASLHRLNSPADAEEDNTPDAFRDHARFVFNNLSRLTTRPAHIKQLRQTILNLAVRGKLVPQDPNDEPAAVLHQRLIAEAKSYAVQNAIAQPRLDSVVEQAAPFASPPGWIWARLASLFKFITDGDHQPPPKSESGVAFLTIGNVTTGHLDFSNCRFVPQDYFDSVAPYRRPAKGDILYTVVGATYGRPALVETDRTFCVQRHIGILKPTSEVQIKYLRLLLASPLVYEQATRNLTGTAQPTIPLRPLRNFLVPLPPLAEQHRIVAKVDELMTLCDQLEAQLTTTEADSRRLLEAVLHEALAPALEEAA